MAARIPADPVGSGELIDLRRLSARDLEALLEEETDAWRAELDWDFEKSADLVRRYVDLRALSGFALMHRGAVAGYLYYVLEESKGLIGDLYVRRAQRTPERESLLLESALDAMMGTPRVNRIESQLMMIEHGPGRPIPFAPYASEFPRNFMQIDLRRAALAEGRVRYPVYLERWSGHYQDAAAQLISEAYAGHVDSSINDQYRSVAGARRFLYNIVQYPGCGAFFAPASYAAFEAKTGRLCGISLASIVAPDCGHITQICVGPALRGTGVGHALLRRSLMTLRDSECPSATLTVTASNTGAVQLYERVGFRTIRRFSACVWEGF
jgi:ribosomal protein S18 acetylase RimI-like enzyme